jgi:hypothetical protein
VASTIKKHRVLVADARRFVSSYLGVRVNPKIFKDSEAYSETSGNRSRVRQVVSIPQSFFARPVKIKRLRNAVLQEFVHSGVDSFFLKSGFNSPLVFSESISMLVALEPFLPREKNKLMVFMENYIDSLAKKKHFSPYLEHNLAFPIMLNIIERFPDKKQRRLFVQSVLRENVAALKSAKKGDALSLDDLGRIVVAPRKNA